MDWNPHINQPTFRTYFPVSLFLGLYLLHLHLHLHIWTGHRRVSVCPFEGGKKKKVRQDLPVCCCCCCSYFNTSLSWIILQPGQESGSTASPASDAGGVGKGAAPCCFQWQAISGLRKDNKTKKKERITKTSGWRWYRKKRQTRKRTTRRGRTATTRKGRGR